MFGIQLLGKYYTGRLALDDEWETTEIGEQVSLVRHREPEAWYAAPLASDSQILAQARAAFDPVLYRPGALARWGYADVS